MNAGDLLRLRLRAQLIDPPGNRSPRDVVGHLLAVQAQDYAGATWAVGLRTPNATLRDVERSIEDRSIVRTWPMRGTLHFVTSEDVRWLLPLTAPRILAGAARREAQLGLDDAQFCRARELLTGALLGGRRLSRPEAMALLDAGGVSTAGQRGYHVLWRLAQEGLIVVGPLQGRQQTFALLEEWVPRSVESDGAAARGREESLGILAERYFVGHGPATVADLARWAGIPKGDATAALAAVKHHLEYAESDGERFWFAPELAGSAGDGGGRIHLLPGFDEYMLGYTGRGLQLGEHLEAYGSRVAANGMLSAVVVAGGRAVGTWRRTLTSRSVRFETRAFEGLSASQEAELAREQERYARFLGRSVSWTT